MQKSSWRRRVSKLLMFQDRKVAPLERLVAVETFVIPRMGGPVNEESPHQVVSLTKLASKNWQRLFRSEQPCP